MSSRTYVLVAPLAPAVEAAWKARADVFFAECRAAHDAEASAKISAILAAEQVQLALPLPANDDAPRAALAV